MDYVEEVLAPPSHEVPQLIELEVVPRDLPHRLPDQNGIGCLLVISEDLFGALLELLRAYLIRANPPWVEHAPRGDLTEPLGEQLRIE